MNSRRRLVRVVGAALLATPLRSLAQTRAKVWRIGFLSSRRRPASLDTDYYGAFPRRMRELGYVEGSNLVIEWRFADGDYERLAGMAAELVQLGVDVILALGPPGVVAARKATSTIPIVIVTSVDPVAAGFVKSLARPGGNVTGISNLAGDLGAKHLDMLHAAVPGLSRIAVLTNPGNTAHAAALKNVEAAARKAGISVVPAAAKSPAEIEGAFSAIVRERAAALVVTLDPLFIQQVGQIAALALKHRLPSIFANREYAEAGGLMSYGQNQGEIYRRAAEYVDRILKGAKPGELPVEQPTKVELLVNRKTAQQLGITIPGPLLAIADSVIE